MYRKHTIDRSSSCCCNSKKIKKKIKIKKNLLYVDNPASLYSILFQCGLKLYFFFLIFDIVVVLMRLIPVDSEGKKIDAHSRANCTGGFNWFGEESSPLMTAILQKKAGWNVWSGQAHTHTHSLTHTHAYAYDGVKEGKL